MIVSHGMVIRTWIFSCCTQHNLESAQNIEATIQALGSASEFQDGLLDVDDLLSCMWTEASSASCS